MLIHESLAWEGLPVGEPLLARAAAALHDVLLQFEHAWQQIAFRHGRSEEHTSELQSLMRISYAVFCLKKKTTIIDNYYSQISLTNSTYCTYLLNLPIYNLHIIIVTHLTCY